MDNLNQHATLRLQTSHKRWIEDFAERWNTTPSYVIRAAIRRFIEEQTQRQTGDRS
jgi:predicted transcriptional regulator